MRTLKNNESSFVSAFAASLFTELGVANESDLLMSASANHPSALSSVDISIWAAVQSHDSAERAYLSTLTNLNEATARVIKQIESGDDLSCYGDQVSSYAAQAAEYATKMKAARAVITTLLGVRKNLV